MKGKETEKEVDTYFQWLDTATGEEKNLQNLMLDYEEKYFQDMTYNKVDWKLTNFEIIGGKTIDSSPDFFINLDNWTIKLKNLRNSEC